ncbi:MAG: hypothetical protein ACRC46_05200 [Thermoguttaceae bacterium]
MKKFNLYVATFCTLTAAIIGVSLVTYAGPCYTLTRTVGASQKGCYETFIGSSGAMCPALWVRITADNTNRPCGFSRYEMQFGVGTSGNERTGRMNQDFVTRICWQTEHCNATSPYWNISLPICDGMVYDCISTGRQNGINTASSFEPTGAECTLE